MKKLLSLLLVILMSLSFVSCKNKENAVNEKNNAKPEKKTEQKKQGEEKGGKNDPLEDEKNEEETFLEFAIDEKYFSLMGQRKENVDSVLGTPTGYNAEFGMAYYNNMDLMVGYNTLGTAMSAEEIPSSNIAVSAYIMLKDLFLNCPETLTKQEVSSLFPKCEESTDEQDGTRVLVAYYKNTMVFFYSLAPDTKVLLKYEPSVYYPPIENKIPITSEENDTSAYYDYARSHHDEFKLLNSDCTDENYYALADVDHDGKDELVVKLYLGLAVYKSTPSGINEIYRDTCSQSGGSWGCTLATYKNKHYIMWYNGNFSQAKNLYVTGSGATDKTYVTGVCYGLSEDGGVFPSIKNERVSQREYDKMYNEISECAYESIESLK
ncbi:MAG: hypothetical protein IJZ81_01345 [Clostridia bacterium]|nr:hypothetical protein [Clostridia bacterium]